MLVLGSQIQYPLQVTFLLNCFYAPTETFIHNIGNVV